MSEMFVGTLSGTSMDGIDAALVRFAPGPELVAAHSVRFPADLRADMLALCVPGANEVDRLGRIDVMLGKLFGQAVRELLEKAGVRASDVRAVGSHGQTIRHRPGYDPAFTLQIGDPNAIAAEAGIDVVADFRRKDMALGGQGAPLVPAFHESVFRSAGADRVVVNIGGIANITVLPADAKRGIVGFDTGPGNTLLDAWARRVLNEPMDRGGQLAARGQVDATLLEVMFADPYFAKNPPKSTGPEHFSMDWLLRAVGGAGAIGEADVQATLVALTADSIANAIGALPGLSRPEVFVCGGGAHNDALMRRLRAKLPESRVGVTGDVGVDGDWVEAMAFAWLAYRHVRGEPGNCPDVTGASRPAVLGGLFPAG